MKTYKIAVVCSYWNEIIVEAENRDDAENKAFWAFDINKAYQGEREVHSVEIISNQKETA